MSAAKPSHGCSVPTFHRHPHPCNVLLSARRASKQATEQAHSKAQCLTPTKGCVSRRGGSLSDSFRFVPPSQHLSERRERDRRRIKRVRGAKAGTFVCLWSEMFLLSTFYFLYLRHTHTREDDSVLRQCDNVLVGHSVHCTVGRSVSL